MACLLMGEVMNRETNLQDLSQSYYRINGQVNAFKGAQIEAICKRKIHMVLLF